MSDIVSACQADEVRVDVVAGGMALCRLWKCTRVMGSYIMPLLFLVDPELLREMIAVARGESNGLSRRRFSACLVWQALSATG